MSSETLNDAEIHGCRLFGEGMVCQVFQRAPLVTIVKSRTVLENIVNKLYKKYIGDYHSINLDTRIKRTKYQGVIDNKACGWFNAVRILGNAVVHPDEAITVVH